MAIIPQTQSFKIFGAGADLGATTLTLQSFKNLDGSNLTMAHFGGTKGFLTIEPSSGTQEEQVSFASITNNANGTVTLGTIKTVLDYTPFTETNGLAKTHGGNVEVIVSNTSGFYNNIIDGATASQIINVPAGNIAATNVQTAINELDTETLHKAGTEGVTGVKTFDETVVPRISATHSYVPGEELYLTTKDYVDNVAGSAVVANASTTVKGIVEEATDAEVLASTTTGGTGARLYVNPGSVGNAANKIPFVTSTGKLPTSIMPNFKFGGTGADGALTQSSGAFNIDLGGAKTFIKNYSSISITGTGYITFTNKHANGTLIIFKNTGASTITTSATSAFVLDNMGADANTNSSSTFFGPQRGEIYADRQSPGGGTGGGGGGSCSNNGTGNSSASFGLGAGLVLFMSKNIATGAGGGNGAKGYLDGPNYGLGGKGGGALYIESAGDLNISSTITAKGENGTNATGSSGGGGGGGGGQIIILANSITTNTPTLTVSGGTGGAGGAGGGGTGGTGGAGYSYVGLNTEFV